MRPRAPASPALAAVVAVLAVAGLLAGCGNDAKDDYAADVQMALDPLADLGSELEGATSAEELAESLERTQERLQAAADELVQISAPDDVAEINQDLVAAVEGFGASIEPLREAIAADDPEALRRAGTDLQRASAEFQAKLAEITRRAKEAGVPVEPPADPSGS